MIQNKVIWKEFKCSNVFFWFFHQHIAYKNLNIKNILSYQKIILNAIKLITENCVEKLATVLLIKSLYLFTHCFFSPYRSVLIKKPQLNHLKIDYESVKNWLIFFFAYICYLYYKLSSSLLNDLCDVDIFIVLTLDFGTFPRNKMFFEAFSFAALILWVATIFLEKFLFRQ